MRATISAIDDKPSAGVAGRRQPGMTDVDVTFAEPGIGSLETIHCVLRESRQPRSTRAPSVRAAVSGFHASMPQSIDSRPGAADGDADALGDGRQMQMAADDDGLARRRATRRCAPPRRTRVGCRSRPESRDPRATTSGVRESSCRLTMSAGVGRARAISRDSADTPSLPSDVRRQQDGSPGGRHLCADARSC